MINYKDLGEQFYYAGLWVTTDEQMVNWIIEKIRTKIPLCDFKHIDNGRTKETVEIINLDGKQIEIGQWLMDVLSEQGWELYDALWSTKQGLLRYRYKIELMV